MRCGVIFGGGNRWYRVPSPARRELGGELGALVTYDERMVAAAKQLGYRIVQPS